MSKKILIIVSNAHSIGPRNRRTGIFLPEVAHPYAEFQNARYRIDFASLTGDVPYLDALHLADDPQNLSFLVGKGWATMQKATAFIRGGRRSVQRRFCAGRPCAHGGYA